MSAALYRLALRAFPKRHRDRYQPEMLDAFERSLAARRAAGGAVATFVAAACLDAIGTGLADRRRRHVVRRGYAFSSLDFSLAWRMMRRYPGLSVVSVAGMAVGIAVATGAFTIVAMLMDTRLPLPDGDRVVSLVSIDAATSVPEFRLVRDYAAWRVMTSMQDVGINQVVTRNLLVAGRTPEPVTVVETVPAAFRVAGVAAVRGRYLMAEDQAADAPDAVVIGYHEWVQRFDGATDIIGRSLQLGAVTYQIVGVMPEGFAFPVNHAFWIPWRFDPSLYPPRTGPMVGIYGRLARGATLESAQAELTSMGQRAAADSPSTHQHLRPSVRPYVHAFTNMGSPGNFLAMQLIRLSLLLLLVIVCVNVAILIYARTATRQGEIAVRTALGASRRRIVAQLFVEALTLAGAAAVIGVFLVSLALPHLEAAFLDIIGGPMPFWLAFRLTTGTATVVVLLALLAAGIVGVLPALKATNRNVHTRLQMLAPGSGSRMQMGRVWTLLIVAQVAMTVALLPAAMFFTWDGLRLRTGHTGFASHEFVSASLAMDRLLEPAALAADRGFESRFALAHRDLDQRLRSDPRVVDTTFSLLDAGQEFAMALEAEGQPLPATPVRYNMQEGSRSGHLVRYNKVATNFFGAFDVPVMLGRGFSPADLATDHVIVNHALAQAVFGTANPLGARIKYVGRSPQALVDDDYAQRLVTMPASIPLERWYEVVGVVSDFPANEVEPISRVYHPVAFGEVYPARVGVRVRVGDPATFSVALRETTAAVSPELQLRDITTAEILETREQGLFRVIGATVGLVMASVIALSAAGIYALMSFTVARRRREIGIRSALGASRRQLLFGIFSRAVGQLGLGVVVGVLGAIGLQQVLDGGFPPRQASVVLPLVAIVMVAVGAVSVVGPAREGLRIQPTDALREE